MKARLLLAALLLTSAACGGGNESTTSTEPSVILGPQTQLFEGTIEPGGSAFYSFTVTQTGNVNVMLASVSTSSAPSGTSPALSLGIGLGTPLGTDCSVTTSTNATPGLTSQLTSNMTPGIYCARVFDIGTVRSKVTFAVRIVHT